MTIKDYWKQSWDPKTGNEYIKVRGTLDNNGGLRIENTPISLIMNYQLGFNIFETELECVEHILKVKRDMIEQIRLEIDELEIKIGKLKWPNNTNS